MRILFKNKSINLLNGIIEDFDPIFFEKLTDIKKINSVNLKFEGEKDLQYLNEQKSLLLVYLNIFPTRNLDSQLQEKFFYHLRKNRKNALSEVDLLKISRKMYILDKI